MRKMVFAALVASMFALTSILAVAAVPARGDEMQPLRCTIKLVFDMSLPPEDWHWEGTISGDVTGTMAMYERPGNYVVGTTEHFWEDFVITTSGGDVIKGHDQGIWTMKTLKFTSHGSVTEASGDWSYLVGCDLQMRGVTTAFPPIPPSTSVVGTGSIMLEPQL